MRDLTALIVIGVASYGAALVAVPAGDPITYHFWAWLAAGLGCGAYLALGRFRSAPPCWPWRGKRD